MRQLEYSLINLGTRPPLQCSDEDRYNVVGPDR